MPHVRGSICDSWYRVYSTCSHTCADVSESPPSRRASLRPAFVKSCSGGDLVLDVSDAIDRCSRVPYITPYVGVMSSLVALTVEVIDIRLSYCVTVSRCCSDGQTLNKVSSRKVSGSISTSLSVFSCDVRWQRGTARARISPPLLLPAGRAELDRYLLHAGPTAATPVSREIRPVYGHSGGSSCYVHTTRN